MIFRYYLWINYFHIFFRKFENCLYQLIMDLFSFSDFEFQCFEELDWVRRKYSSQFFSWLGNISLELFICQYHIWLTNDTHSVLVTLPNRPLVNSLLTSAILISIAHEIHQITSVVMKFMLLWCYFCNSLVFCYFVSDVIVNVVN